MTKSEQEQQEQSSINKSWQKNYDQEKVKSAREKAKKCFRFFKTIGVYDGQKEEDSDLNQVLQNLFTYRTKKFDIIVTEEILPNNQWITLSPAIFTKKPNQFIRNLKTTSPQIISFENYLSVIAQMYYKQQFNIMECLISMDNNKEVATLKQNQTTTNKKEAKTDKKQQGKLRTKKEDERKKKLKKKETDQSLQSFNAQDDQMQDENEEGNAANSVKNMEQQNEENNKMSEEKLESVQNLQFSNILDSLLSPLRFEQVYENWTPKEIAIFESALCKFGKQLGFIAELIKTKTSQEVFEFYIMWKQTSHYKQWKTHRNLLNRHNFSNLV